MKGVLDSMSILKDCEAKDKLMDVVKDCFDNKKMAMDNEEELTATLDSMWIDIHGDSLGEIVKAFSKLAKKPEEKTVTTTDTEPQKDSEPDKKDEGKDGDNKDTAEPENKEGKDGKDGDNKDTAEPENKEGKDGDNKDTEPKKDEGKEKDGCNKDSAEMLSAVMDSIKAELKPLVADAVKECLGLKENNTKPEGGVVDSGITGNDVPLRDYSSFLE